MENEALNLLLQGGDTAFLIAIIGLGYHKLSVRLTIIETLLKKYQDEHDSG